MNSVSAEGSEEAEWDIVSWNELKNLADTTPAAGVWLQSMSAVLATASPN